MLSCHFQSYSFMVLYIKNKSGESSNKYFAVHPLVNDFVELTSEVT